MFIKADLQPCKGFLGYSRDHSAVYFLRQNNGLPYKDLLYSLIATLYDLHYIDGIGGRDWQGD